MSPENLYFSETGDLEGVIANGYEYKSLKNGQKVRLGVRDMMVFEDDGTLEQMLTIQT